MSDKETLELLAVAEGELRSAIDSAYMIDSMPRRWLKLYGNINLAAIEARPLSKELRNSYKVTRKRALSNIPQQVVVGSYGGDLVSMLRLYP